MRQLLQLLILARFPHATLAGSYSILPLTYQSHALTLNDWVTLFTLCFAPLFAHVLSGVPKIVYLSQDRPNWGQKLGLYNPTTILWRYFAIADRRMRAKRWTPLDLSVANICFWTRRGWDGSETISKKSQAYCVSLPYKTHATLSSASTVKTIIVTLQGVDALYLILTSHLPGNNAPFVITASVGSIFYPLAILGLLRLVACFWLTEDSTFANCEKFKTTVARLVAPGHVGLLPVYKSQTNDLSISLDDLVENQYHPPNSWRSRSFRILFFGLMVSLIALSMTFMIPSKDPYTAATAALSTASSYTTTTYALGIFYVFFLAISTAIYGYYLIRSRNTTTVLPCVASLWYQIYTGILLALVIVLITISSIETRKSACGSYTTWPSYYHLCGVIELPAATNTSQGILGVAVIGNMTSLNFTQPDGKMSVLKLHGYFQTDGHFNGKDYESFQYINTTERWQT